MASGRATETSGTSEAGVQVDLSVIRQLHADVGRDVEITRDLLQSYELRAPELISAVGDAARSRENEQVGQFAHDLRSISGFVGATSIADIAAELEAGVRPAAEIVELASELCKQLPSVLSQLRRVADEL